MDSTTREDNLYTFRPLVRRKCPHYKESALSHRHRKSVRRDR